MKSRVNIVFVILGFLILCSCINKGKTQRSEVLLPNPIDSTILQFDSITVQGIQFKVLFKNDYFIYVLKEGDTISKLECNNGFEFSDFNFDGFKDIIVSYMTNVGGIVNVLQFDPKLKLFRQIENLTNYPLPIHIENNYFYSYSRAGCADNNWKSYLFRIEDFHTICMGEIWGQGCERDSMKIDIFKVLSSDRIEKRLIESLPLDTIYKFKKTKWGFIKYYWTKNYLSFK